MANPKLAIAFDTGTQDAFWRLFEKTQELDFVVKVGLQLLSDFSLKDLERIKKSGKELFVDAKLHDIPKQVSEAVKNFAGIGADFLTIHTQGGAKMIEESLEAAGSSCRILGVTLLTSLDDSDLKSMGQSSSSGEYARILAENAKQAGLTSFVCSAQEAGRLLEVVPKAFLCTPGIRDQIRDQGSASDDQKRSLSLEEALAAGTSLPVVGRPVITQEDPASAAKSFLNRLEKWKAK